MSVQASVIITRARDVLIDAGATRWPDAEMLRWLSDGQRAVVMAIPTANTKRATISLAAGTLQNAPADCFMLLSVDRNNGALNGTQPGKAIRIVSRQLIENFNPDWHTATQSSTALSYVYDPNTPKQFFVSPPNDGTGYADIVYSQLPADVTTTSQNISVDDIYQTPLVDYLLYRSFQKDADYTTVQSIYSAVTLAGKYLESFNQALGIKMQSDASRNPNIGPPLVDQTNSTNGPNQVQATQ